MKIQDEKQEPRQELPIPTKQTLAAVTIDTPPRGPKGKTIKEDLGALLWRKP